MDLIEPCRVGNSIAWVERDQVRAMLRRAFDSLRDPERQPHRDGNRVPVTYRSFLPFLETRHTVPNYTLVLSL